MARAIAIRHLAFEDLGLFGPLLRGHGFDVQLIDAWRDLEDAASADLLIVLGGPIGVYEQKDYPFLAAETALLKPRITARRPTLGICLGAQLMAAAMGQRVYPGPVKEIGWQPIELTHAGHASALSAIGDLPVLHWHGDTFDLPESAALLASTAAVPHQAFSIGPNVLGLQFHLEVDAAMIDAWLIGHTMELGQAGVSIGSLRAATRTHGPKLEHAARQVFNRWLANLDPHA